MGLVYLYRHTRSIITLLLLKISKLLNIHFSSLDRWGFNRHTNHTKAMACLDDEKLADCIIAVRGDSKPDKIIALAAGWAYILNKKPSDIRIIKSYVRFVIKQKPILDSDYFMLMSLLDTTTFYLPEKIVRALISSSDLSYEEMDIVLADKGIKLERASLLYSGDVRWLGR